MNLKSITLSKNRNSNSLVQFTAAERKVLLGTIDFSILLLTLFFYYKSNGNQLNIQEFVQQNFQGVIYGFSLFFFLSIVLNLYNLEYINKTKRVLPLAFFIGILFTTIYVLSPILTPHLPKQRIYIFGFVFGFTFLLTIWRLIYTKFIHTRPFFQNVILLVSNNFENNNNIIENAKRSIEGINYQNGYKIQRIYSIPSDNKSLKTLIRTLTKITSQKIIDNIVILDENEQKLPDNLSRVLVRAIQKGVNVQTYFKLYEDLKEALPLNLSESQFYAIFPSSRYNTNFVYYLWHRTIDIVSSIFGLMTAIFLIPFITLINLFVNQGPLFYSQLRVGKGGKEFKITKFRSMVTDAEKDGAKMSSKGDSRITSLGKFMRKTRIDELPQFWSVLNGDMSLIGPRPERKIFIDELNQVIPFFNARHLVRPGITGWAQVKYPYGENLEDSYNKLEYDLYYIKNRSVTLDVRIIFKTINTIIFSKGQ